MSDLKTDYRDDVLDVSANAKRIFNLVDQDGKIVVANVSIQDITKYTQEGDSFGAADINATNEAVNGKLDGSSTVDPMLATEEGFAADAYQTKLQFEEQNKNIDSCFQSVSSGKALVASAITGKGVKTASDAAFATMANNINNIKDVANNTPGTATAKMLTKGFTAWVNGKLITGERPARVDKQSGNVGGISKIEKGRSVSGTVNFTTQFDEVPTVTYVKNVASTNYVSELVVTIKNITRAGFDWTMSLNLTEYHSYCGSPSFTWTAITS